MTANNCDDAFQRDQELQQRKRELQQELEGIDRQLNAAWTRVSAPPGDSVIIPGRDGTPREMDTADVQRGYQQLAATMSSKQVDDFVGRGLDQRTRPLGSEGRFQNYDRLIREVDLSTREDYARFAEALGITHERIAPDDFAFVTRRYGKEKLIELVSDYYRDLGASDADLLARAAVKTAPAINAVENKLWLRFWADRTKRVYLDSLEQIRDYAKAIPGAKPPPELMQEAFRQYKLALVMERHNNLVTRRHAQALRSQQENILDLEQFRLDLGDEFEQGVTDAIGMTGKDLGADEHFARVVDAIDNGDSKQLDFLIDTTKIDGLDPKARLDKDWFNTHMRMATALVKDSQLGNLNTQYLNLGSNGVMAIFGPVQQTFYNGARLTPIGTQLTRAPLMEALKITSEAHNYAWTTLRATWSRDLQRVFQNGVSHYSGNLDTYGKRLLTNEQEIADMQGILDMPYRPGPNWAMRLVNPHNMGIFTNKLQAAARILFLTKPGGTFYTGMNRLEASVAALGLSRGEGIQRISAKDIDLYTPWKPALRAMAGVDEVFGKYHYLFKLKAELEVKARMEGNQLGLFDDRTRAEWVQRQLDEAIYQATPSESDIKAFRKQNGLKGSDFTDDEIGAMLAERNMAGAPTMATPESVEALRYSSEMRFQDAPTGNPGEVLDRGMMGLRQNWMVDRYVMPYWRSPFMGLLFDHRLATFGVIDTIKMINAGKDASPELVARVKAGWVMSGALLAAFGVLDAAGQVGGGTDPDPDRRNTLFGMKLGGFPVLNVLFLWKDVKDAATSALTNDYDGNELAMTTMKVLTSHITRQAGVQQLHLLLEAMLSGTEKAGEKLSQFVGFMGAGQIPFIGAERNLERALGMDRQSFYRDEPSTANQEYLLGLDDATAKAEQFLRNFLMDTIPLAAGALGAKRKEADHLGTPRGHVLGINLSRAFPMFFPAVWPKGKVNDVVYSELDTQDMLDPPKPLLERKLDGIAMSDDLQQEYNDIHGKIKAPADLPPSARMGLAGKSVDARFSMPIETVTSDGIRIRKDGGASLPLTQILDRVTNGRTKKEAFYALFTSPWYQRLEDDDKLSSAPPGGLPPALRREKIAQKLIRGVTDYYDLLTQDELERRAAAGTSQPAKEWSEAKTKMTIIQNQQAVEELREASKFLKGLGVSAQ
jgi:hypothetical protein